MSLLANSGGDISIGHSICKIIGISTIPTNWPPLFSRSWKSSKRQLQPAAGAKFLGFQKLFLGRKRLKIIAKIFARCGTLKHINWRNLNLEFQEFMIDPPLFSRARPKRDSGKFSKRQLRLAAGAKILGFQKLFLGRKQFKNAKISARCGTLKRIKWSNLKSEREFRWFMIDSLIFEQIWSEGGGGSIVGILLILFVVTPIRKWSPWLQRTTVLQAISLIVGLI